MTELAAILVAAALVNNVVLVQLLGVSSLFAASRRLDAAGELALLNFLVMFPAVCASFLLHRFLLQPLNLGFLRLLLFVALSSALAAGLAKLATRRFPLLMRRHDPAIWLMGANSAVIGTALLNANGQGTIAALMLTAFATAAGFSLLLIAFAALRQRLDLAAIPAPFRGAPIHLLSAGIVAMCLLAFGG